MPFKPLQGLKNRHLLRKETVYVFRDKVTLLMRCICWLIGIWSSAFQSYRFSPDHHTQLRFTSTGKPIKLVAVNFPESVFSKDFWQACPEVFLTVLLSIPSGLIFKVWKDMGSLKLSMKPEITFFFPFLFLPRRAVFHFWISIYSQQAILILLQVDSKIFGILHYRILRI